MRKGNRGHSGQSGGRRPDPRHDRVELAQIAALVARRHANGQTVRALAAEIGISRSSVHALVKAHDKLRPMPDPHKNWPKLKAWYIRERYADEGELEEPVDMALLALEFLKHIPEADRPEVMRRQAEFYRGVFDERKLPYPAWLERMIERIERRDRMAESDDS